MTELETKFKVGDRIYHRDLLYVGNIVKATLSGYHNAETVRYDIKWDHQEYTSINHIATKLGPAQEIYDLADKLRGEERGASTAPKWAAVLSTNASVEYEVGHQEIYERLDNIDDRLNILDEIETHLQVMNFVIDTVANNDPVFRDRLAKIEKALIETTGPTKESDISSDIRD